MNAPDPAIRDAAIAYLVEQLRAIEADETRISQQQRAAATDPRYPVDPSGYLASADLHWQVASRCEQLIEEINASLLFDRLDADEAAYEQRIDAQRAELHVDVSDAALCALACRACYPTAVTA